jgi:hypothetical protein
MSLTLKAAELIEPVEQKLGRRFESWNEFFEWCGDSKVELEQANAKVRRLDAEVAAKELALDHRRRRLASIEQSARAADHAERELAARMGCTVGDLI